MALEITATIDNKTGNYWVVTGIVSTYVLSTHVINYGFWKDSQAYTDKEPPIKTYQIKLQGQEYTDFETALLTEGNTPKVEAQNYIKNNVKLPVDLSTANEVI